jgi:N-hydroxyarylamine O-acetyltransferase
MSLPIKPYLSRIHYTSSLEPTFQTLAALHEAHLLAVPFENLDISLGREIILDEAALFRKIVEQRRGGFCYELNGLFASLLRALGFKVTMLSAEVAHASGGFGPAFDHLVLLVQLEEPRLVDVGFGDSFSRPLLLKETLEQVQDKNAYRLLRDGPYWTLQQRSADGTWDAQYRFTLQPRRLSDYKEMCRYQQTSPESHFTRQRVCTLMTRRGRVTLSDMRLIITEQGKRHEQALSNQEEYSAALRERFGINLPGGKD